MSAIATAKVDTVTLMRLLGNKEWTKIELMKCRATPGTDGKTNIMDAPYLAIHAADRLEKFAHERTHLPKAFPFVWAHNPYVVAWSHGNRRSGESEWNVYDEDGLHIAGFRVRRH